MAESGASTDCSADDNGLATPGQTREFSLDINACDERSSCVRCYSLAKLMCERCGDRYCSSECQARDWIRHKKICFPLLFMHQFIAGNSSGPLCHDLNSNAMNSSVDKLDELLKHDEIIFLTPRELRAKSIPSHTNVYITSIVDHKTVFVRPSFAAAEKYLCKLFDDIDQAGERNFRSLNGLPKCGGIYLVNFEEEFYRVYVLAASSRNNKIDVFFIDFGNIDCVWLSQLSELSDELGRRPIFLNKISLANVPEIAFNENPMRFLNQIYDDEVELTLFYDQKSSRRKCRTIPKICQLKFVDEELTVNRKLVRLNSNLFSVEQEKCPNYLFTQRLPIFIYDITYLWDGDYNVDMQILQNSKIDSFGYLTCIRRDKRATFDRNMAEVAEHGENMRQKDANNMLRPSLHEVCLVERTDRKRWYRAFCADDDVHQIDAVALMVLLDYDEVLEMPYNQIWKLPPALAFPVLTIDCFIRELIPRPHKMSDQLNLQNEFKLNRNITFDSMQRIPNAVKSASVSYKKVHMLLRS